MLIPLQSEISELESQIEQVHIQQTHNDRKIAAMIVKKYLRKQVWLAIQHWKKVAINRSARIRVKIKRHMMGAIFKNKALAFGQWVDLRN